MKISTLISFSLVLGFITISATAHPGPRIWIGDENNQLVTHQQSGTDYLPEQVFLQPLNNIADNVWTTNFPGYEVIAGSNVNGSDIGFDFTGPLLRYTGNGIGFTELTAATDAKLAITRNDLTAYSSTGVGSGFVFFHPLVSGDHAHVYYTPCADGTNPGGAPDGVYIQPLRLTGTNLDPSNWYFLVLSQSGTTSDQSDATSLAQTMASATKGDANFDTIVDFNDLLTVAQNYGTTSGSWWTRGDFNFDGAVNFSDVLNVAQNYSSASNFDADWNLVRSTVPEPSVIFSFSIVALLLRRK